MSVDRPPAVTMLGVPVHQVTMDAALAQVEKLMQEPGLHQIATANPEFVMRAQKDAGFLAILRRVDLSLADGIGLVWISAWYGARLPERVPGSELVYHLAERCARRGWRLFLLGAAPGVAEKAGERLIELYPGLEIAGTYAGSPAPAENDEIVTRINESRADVLYVAYGAPNQDRWIDRNRDALLTVRMAMGVGGSLDFISGRVQRAPGWMQRLGIEWVFRLLQQPWRWRRMLAIPRFVWAAWKEVRGR